MDAQADVGLSGLHFHISVHPLIIVSGVKYKGT